MKNIAFSKIWIIGILAVVLAGGFFAWQYWAPKPAPADEIVRCAKEGERMGDIMSGRPCCSGLVDRYAKTPMRNKANEVVCIEEMTRAICVKPGDGVCGKGEDWCISPEDCPKPNPEGLELYPF